MRLGGTEQLKVDVRIVAAPTSNCLLWCAKAASVRICTTA